MYWDIVPAEWMASENPSSGSSGPGSSERTRRRDVRDRRNNKRRGMDGVSVVRLGPSSGNDAVFRSLDL